MRIIEKTQTSILHVSDEPKRFTGTCRLYTKGALLNSYVNAMERCSLLAFRNRK